MAKKSTKRASGGKPTKSASVKRGASAPPPTRGKPGAKRVPGAGKNKGKGRRGAGSVMRDSQVGMRTRPSKDRTIAKDPKRAAAEAAAQKFALDAARMLSDDKCTDVIVMDVREKSQLSDFIVIASGTSDRQMRSGAEHLRDLAHEQGHDVFRTNLDEQTTWIVLDCVDVVIHIFEPNQRAFYDLEMLWGDAPRLKWERAGRATAAAAAE